MPFCVGLTGGIGSGKSTATRLFQDWGAGIVDVDDISHALTKVGARPWWISAAGSARILSPPMAALIARGCVSWYSRMRRQVAKLHQRYLDLAPATGQEGGPG